LADNARHVSVFLRAIVCLSQFDPLNEEGFRFNSRLRAISSSRTFPAVSRGVSASERSKAISPFLDFRSSRAFIELLSAFEEHAHLKKRFSTSML